MGKMLVSFTSNMVDFWKITTGECQLHWLGQKKGVIQLVTGAVVTAVLDLHAKVKDKLL
ncbi:hypothetical protein [Winogradskyella forsetii]|uniref:hypothetical protein n=2 Tax=Winogradskyella forsetii TaxID=2686077 RepID=UPI0015BAC192|nr:hypothetical protein [Winogradskyella forsetii]